MNHTSRDKGSSLILVIILVFALSIIIASLLQTLISDKRMNRRIHLAGEARNAAEGVVEVAVAEVDRRAASYSSMPTALLSGFSFPSDVQTFLATGNVDAASLTFKSGNLSPLPNAPVVIDGGDPFNVPDIDKGKPVILRHAYIYGKASATDPITGQAVTSYVSNLVQIREQTWLNYAVFYNLDMEMHSGSAMDIDGPVHTNQTAYLTSGAGNNLRFWGSLTTPKTIRRTYKYGGTVTHTGNVAFTSKPNPSSGDLLTMSTSQDSIMNGFKTFAENRWKGFVQEQSFAVPVFNPPGLLQYTQDDHTTSGTNEMRNSAYAMIEPQLANVSFDNAATHTYSGYKGDTVENQKFSALAGLTIRIKAATWTSPPSANPIDPGFELVYFSGANPTSPVNRANLPQRDGITKKPVEYPVRFDRMQPELLDMINAAVKVIKYEETGTGTAGNKDLKATTVAPSGTDKDRYGLYDRRQGYQGTSSNNALKGAHHTVQIDMGKFNVFLNAPEAKWADKDDPSTKVYDRDASYSGVVYVQFPMVPDTDSAVSARKTTDAIRPAVAPTTTAAGYALVLRNAKVLPQLPSNPSVRDDGLTLATNGPVYIMGHYNADGLSGTGSSSAPDTTNPASNTEVPALIAADAVTLLSSAYTDAAMKVSAKTLGAAAFTEIATGIISGIVPTRLNTSGNGTGNQWAGGVHNFVRFLEDWTGDTYRSRGSVVCLYENEVSTGPWYQTYFTYWYQFPGRDIGYHAYFSGGRFPPGLPVMRTVRRISVADLTAAQYTAGPPTPPVAAN